MKNRCVDFIKKYAGWILLFIFFLIISSSITNYNDDEQFKNAIENYGSLYNWAGFYGENWGGRIIPHGILVILLQLPEVVFQFLNALMMWATVFLYNYIFLDGKYSESAVFPLAAGVTGIFLIPGSIATAVFWKCASVLYLWSFPAMMLAVWPGLIIYKGRKPSWQQLVLAVICGIYVAGTEQMAVFLMVFSVILLVYNSLVMKKINAGLLITVAINSVLAIYCLLLPGNAYRSIEETVAWQNNFGSFNLWEKILIGISFALRHFVSDFAIFFLVIAFIVIYGIYNQKSSWYIKFMAGVPFIYYLVAFARYIAFEKNLLETSSLFGRYLLNRLFVFLPENYVRLEYSLGNILAVILGTGMVVILGILLSVSGKAKQEKADFITTLLFWGGCCTLVIMGFSPTLVASGDRSLFTGMLLIMMAAGRILSGYIKYPKEV